VAILEHAVLRQPCGLAVVTGSAELVADITPAMEKEGFATHSVPNNGLDQLERIRALVPARTLDCYVQLPTTDLDRDGVASVAGLRALVANALLARLDILAALAHLIAPAGRLVIVSGDRAGTVRDVDLGLPGIAGVLAEAVLAGKGAQNVQVTVVGGDRTAADIAAVARGHAPPLRTTTSSPGVALGGYAAVSPELSFVDWRQEVLGLATELGHGCPPRA
jgi:hypothetical protein